MNSFSDLLGWIWRSTKRIVVFVVGVGLVAVGVAMFVLPGPGIVVVVLGLAVLATEFVWAEVALDKAKEKAAQAGSAAKQGFGRLRRKRPETAATDDGHDTDAGSPAPDAQPVPPPST